MGETKWRQVQKDKVTVLKRNVIRDGWEFQKQAVAVLKRNGVREIDTQ